MRFDTPQYDSIKNYIRRLNKFSKAKKQLPPYKEFKQPKGVTTRAKSVRRGRSRPRKYPKSVIEEDPEDDGPNEIKIVTTRGRN